MNNEDCNSRFCCKYLTTFIVYVALREQQSPNCRSSQDAGQVDAFREDFERTLNGFIHSEWRQPVIAEVDVWSKL